MAHRDDHGRKVPSWNGQADLWETYKDEVRIWLLGSPNTEEYSLAARLVAHLCGHARRIGLSLSDEDLMPTTLEPPEEEGEEAGEGSQAGRRPRRRCRVTHKPAIDALLAKLQWLRQCP